MHNKKRYNGSADMKKPLANASGFFMEAALFIPPAEPWLSGG